MDETYGPVVREGGGIWSLGEHREEGLVELLEAAPVQGVELVEGVTNILLDDVPASA